MNKQDIILPSWLFRKSMFTLIFILALLLALAVGKFILLSSPTWQEHTSSTLRIEQTKK